MNDLTNWEDAKKERYYDHAKDATDALRVELNRTGPRVRASSGHRASAEDELVGRYYFQSVELKRCWVATRSEQALTASTARRIRRVPGGTYKAD